MFPRSLSLLPILLLAACASTPYQPHPLTGQVTLPANTLLQIESTMVHLTLLDISGSGGAANLLSEQFINKPAQFPVVFDLSYDQNAISASGHYELDAQVFAAGQLRLQGAQQMVIKNGVLPATMDVAVKSIGQ